MESLSSEEELAGLLKTLFAEKRKSEELKEKLEVANTVESDLQAKLTRALQTIESLKCQSDDKMFEEHADEVASELKEREATFKKEKQLYEIERARQEEERQKLSLRLSDAFGQIQRLTEQVRLQKEEKTTPTVEEKSRKILEKIKHLLANVEA